jgi:hypothetical protein
LTEKQPHAAEKKIPDPRTIPLILYAFLKAATLPVPQNGISGRKLTFNQTASISRKDKACRCTCWTNLHTAARPIPFGDIRAQPEARCALRKADFRRSALAPLNNRDTREKAGETIPDRAV